MTKWDYCSSFSKPASELSLTNTFQGEAEEPSAPFEDLLNICSDCVLNPFLANSHHSSMIGAPVSTSIACCLSGSGSQALDLKSTFVRGLLIISTLIKFRSTALTDPPRAVGSRDLSVQDPGSQDSPISDADHALLSDDHSAPVMSEGAWLTRTRCSRGGQDS